MRQQVNLYLSSFRPQEQKFSAQTMFQAGAAVVAGILLLAAVNVWQVSRLQSDVADMDHQYTVILERFQTISSTLAARPRDESLEREVQHMERLVAERASVKDVLKSGIFTNTEGFSKYFAAFARQHVAGMWLTSFDITGSAERLTIKGRSRQAEFVPRYIQKLSQEPVLSGTRFQVFRVVRPEEKNKKRRAPFMDFIVTTETDPEALDGSARLALSERLRPLTQSGRGE